MGDALQTAFCSKQWRERVKWVFDHADATELLEDFDEYHELGFEQLEWLVEIHGRKIDSLTFEVKAREADLERLRWLYMHRDFEFDEPESQAELCKAVATSWEMQGEGQMLAALQWAVSVGGQINFEALCVAVGRDLARLRTC